MSTAPEASAPRTGSAGLYAVGVIAIAALALAAYGWFACGRDDSATDRIAVLEQKLSNLETMVAAGASVAHARGGADAAEPQSTDRASAPPPRAAPATENPQAFALAPNPELQGRMGRLLVTFPEGEDVQARTDVFLSGAERSSEGGYGNLSLELPPGIYDLEISGVKVPGVRVQSQHDSRVHVGILRFNATGNTRFDLFTPGGTKAVLGYYGQKDVGLPIGEFEIQVSGQRETFAITSGAITEY